MPPLPTPPQPIVKLKLGYNPSPTGVQYNHHYFRYSGSPLAAADLSAFCTAVRAAWVTHIKSFLSGDVALVAVTAQDLATPLGLSGEDLTTTVGSRSGDPMPSNAPAVIHLGITRKYRGGKPKIFAPLFSADDMDGPSQWKGTEVALLTAAYRAFITDVLALGIGTATLTDLVNISYYSGYGTPRTRSNGHLFYPAALRTVPVIDSVTNVSVGLTIGSQRRRLRA